METGRNRLRGRRRMDPPFYANNPDSYGDANMTVEQFAEAFKMFDDWGVGLHVHSIGDGSIRRVVDALEMMKEANGDSGVRHKIAHNMMIHPDELPRIAAMKDVNIDFSPGIFDLHTHPFITPWYGSMNLSLQNGGDADAIIAEIKAYAKANPDKEWIIGGQYLAGTFPGDNPTKELLDAIVPDRHWPPIIHSLPIAIAAGHLIIA